MIVRAVTPADRLDDDEATLLLYEGRVVKLGPLGAAVVDLATDPVDAGRASPANSNDASVCPRPAAPRRPPTRRSPP